MLDDTCRYMTSRFTAGGVRRGAKKAERSKNRKETARGKRVAGRRKNSMQKREASCPCPGLLFLIKFGCRFKSERLWLSWSYGILIRGIEYAPSDFIYSDSMRHRSVSQPSPKPFPQLGRRYLRVFYGGKFPLEIFCLKPGGPERGRYRLPSYLYQGAWRRNEPWQMTPVK